MFGKSFKDINLLQRPLAVKTSNFEIKRNFLNNDYSFIIINSFKKIIKISKKIYFATKIKLKIILHLYIAKIIYL